MAAERVKILDMLASGKISVEEAERLLAALDKPPQEEARSQEASPSAPGSKPRYLRVVVNETKGERVNVRVPLQLIRAGVSLTAFMPKEAREQVDRAFEKKGLSFNVADLSPEKLDPLIQALTELAVDVQAPDASIRVFCE